MKTLDQTSLVIDQNTDHPFCILGDRTITYKDLIGSVSTISDHLKTLGIKKGDRIAIGEQTDPNYIIILLSLWNIGAVACPLNIRLPADVLQQQMAKIRCKCLLSSIVDILLSEKISIKKYNLAKIVQAPRSGGAEDSSIEIPLSQEATILFTSGSSNAPKAAMHTIGNHYFNAKGSNENIPLDIPDRWLLSLPLYHVSGISIIFRALIAKATIIIATPGEIFPQTVSRHKITHISLVTTQLYRLLERPENIAVLKKLKTILLGGSPIPEALISLSIIHDLPIFISYGLTEMSSQVATSKKLSHDNALKRVKILNYRKVKISDEREILVKGETLFKGYVTSDGIQLPLDKDGWFHTGDLGLLIEGEYLFIRGRKDNMFVSGGENIQPEEVEHILCQMDGIEQAIVVPAENKEFGYRPVAFIKTLGGKNISKSKLLGEMRNKLPQYKIPEEFFLWLPEWDVSGFKANRQRLTWLVRNNPSQLRAIP